MGKEKVEVEEEEGEEEVENAVLVWGVIKNIIISGPALP